MLIFPFAHASRHTTPSAPYEALYLHAKHGENNIAPCYCPYNLPGSGTDLRRTAF